MRRPAGKPMRKVVCRVIGAVAVLAALGVVGAATASSGGLVLTFNIHPNKDDSLVVAVPVGTPSQDLLLTLSGTSELFVYSGVCTTCPTAATPLFNHNVSSTYKRGVLFDAVATPYEYTGYVSVDVVGIPSSAAATDRRGGKAVGALPPLRLFFNETFACLYQSRLPCPTAPSLAAGVLGIGPGGSSSSTAAAAVAAWEGLDWVGRGATGTTASTASSKTRPRIPDRIAPGRANTQQRWRPPALGVAAKSSILNSPGLPLAMQYVRAGALAANVTSIGLAADRSAGALYVGAYPPGFTVHDFDWFMSPASRAPDGEGNRLGYPAPTAKWSLDMTGLNLTFSNPTPSTDVLASGGRVEIEPHLRGLKLFLGIGSLPIDVKADCSNFRDLPTFDLRLVGSATSFLVLAADYVEVSPDGHGGHTCASTLVLSSVRLSEAVVVLGQAFLERHPLAFDLDRGTVGISTRAWSPC